MITVEVPIEGRAYPVVVGHGALDVLPASIPESARRALVVTQQGIPGDVAARLRAAGLEVAVATVAGGEEHKSLETYARLLRECAASGLTRRDVVVGHGGGMVTDLAGFVAASWHRGIPVVHVATTILAMVDAAVGGKTGVNLDAGKNLVGAFWQPSAVVCDLDLLATLPERERRSGNGEMAKYHFLAGDDLLALDLEHRIARCVEIKAGIVAADERESGRRAILNYGHTLGHALEAETNFAVSHGEAVGIGLVFAARLARALGRIDDARVERHEAVVAEEYGLSTRVPDGPTDDALVARMRGDKKATDGLTFVLDSDRGVELVAGVDDAVVRSVLARMRLR